MAWRGKQLLSGLTFSLAAGLATAGQIDFGDAAMTEGSVLSAGFSFQALNQGDWGFLAVDDQPDIVGNGSRRLLAGNRTDVSMVKFGGGKFDLLGLAFGGSWVAQKDRVRWADGIEIVGFRNGASVITQELSLLNAPAALQSVALTGFVGLESVLFRPTKFGNPAGFDYEFVLDDIHVSAVPEPQTWLMLGVGFAALSLRRRRQG